MSQLGSFRLTNPSVTITGDSGGTLSPDIADNFNILGGDNITTSGAGSTLTISATGPLSPTTYTDHAVLVGSGAAAITALTVGTNGQVLLGSTGADPVFATLTSSDGTVTYTTGAGTLDLSAMSLTADAFTGFDSWAGAGPYFDDTTLGTFTLSQSGTGYIEGVAISFAAPQSVTGLTAGNTYYIYIDNTGTLQKTTTLNETLVKQNIVLFECLRDSTTAANIQLTVKENNSYTMPYHTAWYLHEVTGSVISDRNNGANIVLNGTQKIEISGTDYLEDHGLTTTLSDSGGVAVTWLQYFTNGSGKWEQYTSSDTFTGEWNSAGTPTAPTAGKFQIYTLYAAKDDLNSSTPKYIAILNTAEYATQVAAETAISDGTVDTATAELAALELVRLGYIIYSEATTEIIEVLIDKETLRSVSSVNGTNEASLVLTNTATFDGILSATNTTVQSALETIDDWGKTTTDHALLIGNGTGSAIGSLAVGATGEILTGVTGNDAAWSATPSVTSLTATTVYGTTFDTNVAAAGVTLGGTSLLADGTDANIDINITAKGSGQVIIDDLQLTTQLSVSYGGTGATSLTDHSVLVGSGTSAVTALTVGTNGQVLVGSTGADPVFANITAGTAMTVTEGTGTLELSSTGTTLNNQTGTTYTFVIGDAGKFVTFSNASAVTVTVPTNASVAFATGTMIGFMQLGAGQVSFSAAGGVTINSADSLVSTYGQYSTGILIKTDTNVWSLSGDLA